MLGSRQLEALREVVAEGTAAAAVGLSGMLGRELKVTSPGIELLKLSAIPFRVASPGEIVAGVYLRGHGDIHAHFTLVFPVRAALRLCDMLMEMPEDTTQVLGEMERSALGEVGNITTSYFLTAMGEVTGLEIHPSPPVALVDMCGAILGIAISEIAQQGDDALVMETSLALDGRLVTGYFLIMPDPVSLHTLLESLNK